MKTETTGKRFVTRIHVYFDADSEAEAIEIADRFASEITSNANYDNYGGDVHSSPDDVRYVRGSQVISDSILKK